MARRAYCLHHLEAHEECADCERLIKDGHVKERKIYSQQRVWQIEQKAEGRCEICGANKGKCPSASRCDQCLAKDAGRHRKKLGTKRKWIPGDRGRPRYVRNKSAFKRAGTARDKRRSAPVDLVGE